jgi:EAL domain-containing protein (putative c-di-GMP-specific phosphodiesterase class I)/DNA-binding CsgD family transcriptional regulator
MRLLIFDDDAMVGRLVTRVATMSGLDATAVTTADSFARSLKTDPPQVIMLDLQLGDTDGVEQLRVLADQHYLGTLVLMSGFDTRVLGAAGSLASSLGLTVEAVLEKPLRVAELERVFEHLQSAGQSISVERLLAAIANNELRLEFQPVVTRDPPALKKLEALVRWEHPVLGRIPPVEFLPVAERDSATIDALTEWVLGAAIKAYQVLGQHGIAVSLAVNISARNLHDLAFPDRLEQRMRAGGMPSNHLCLEITETAAFEDPVQTMEILSRIRLKGMQLSIDDFGTGYSSLKVLRQMPFTEIKIDLSFVRDVVTSPDARAIAKSIMDLAVNMGMDCVAEGIESEETAAMLETLGVCGLQGYFIGRPMPVEAVSAWLATWMRRAPTDVPPRLPMAVPDVVAVVRQVPEQQPAGSVQEVVNVLARLSPRQTEVMRLLSKGQSVKEIARQLDLGIGTIKVHLSQAYASLGAHNRVEAVMRAGLYGGLP